MLTKLAAVALSIGAAQRPPGRDTDPARKALSRWSGFADQQQPSLVRGLSRERLPHHFGAEDERRVDRGLALRRVQTAPLQHGYAADGQERDGQLEHRRQRTDAAGRCRGKPTAEARPAGSVFSAREDDLDTESERRRDEFQEAGFLGNGFDQRHRPAGRNRQRNCGKASPAADIDERFIDVRHQHEGIADVFGDFGRRACARQIEGRIALQ